MSDVMTEAEFLGTDKKPQEALDGPPFVALTLSRGGVMYARADAIQAVYEVADDEEDDKPFGFNQRHGGWLLSDEPEEAKAPGTYIEIDKDTFRIQESAGAAMLLIQTAVKAPVVFVDEEGE